MHELLLSAPEAQVDAVCDALMDELDALSVSVEDADAGHDDEQALFGEPGHALTREAWRHSMLRALFDDEARATAATTVLLAQHGPGGVQLRGLQAVPDQDWVRLTQSQFAPVEITPSFWIVPSWHAVPAAAERVIRLDPGLAFGTGTHPTTRMCLRWIAEHAQPWPRVLDYGCGSGILAIGAALHGACLIDAVDIDAAAVEATRANAEANAVVLRAGLPDQTTGAYDLVLANILARPLVLLAPLLSRQVSACGHLVLAGILERQADELREAYRPWCRLDVRERMDGWVLMTATLQ